MQIQHTVIISDQSLTFITYNLLINQWSTFLTKPANAIRANVIDPNVIITLIISNYINIIFYPRKQISDQAIVPEGLVTMTI